NLSLPGLTLADAVGRRPAPPIVHRDSALQTAVNFVVGMPGLVRGEITGPTPAEYAADRKAAFVVVELGFAEAIDAATGGDPARIPEASTFRADLDSLLARLERTGSDAIVMTIPDPMDTAHFSTVESASHVLKVPAPAIAMMYALQPGDRI